MKANTRQDLKAGQALQCRNEEMVCVHDASFPDLCRKDGHHSAS